MGKPKRKRKRKRAKAPRAAARSADELFLGVAGFVLGALAREQVASAAPAAQRCARCGHTRADHCGCGKTCLWQGPEEPDTTGLPRRMLCACAGFDAPGLLPEAPYGEGKLGALLDGLLRGKP